MKKILLVGIVVTVLVGMTGLVEAGDMTAKAFGMGGAFTGVANDLTSVIYNPAGLSQSGFLGLQFNGGAVVTDKESFEDALDSIDKIGDDQYDQVDIFTMLPEDLDFNGQILLGANLHSFGLALNSYLNSNLVNKEEDKEFNTETVSEGIICFGYKLVSPPFDLGALSLGANLKMIRSDQLHYVINPISINKIEADGSGLGLDIGALAKVTPLLTLGVQIKNLWASEYTLKGSETNYLYDIINEEWLETGRDYSSSDKMRPERVMRVGASVYVPVVNATLAADIDNFPLLTEGDKEAVFHLGLEKNFLFNGFSLRAGTFKEEEQARYYTLGLGLNILKMHLDMAVGSNDKFEDNISGILSANIKF